MEWISVDDRLPKCNMKPNSKGVPVAVDPPFNDDGYSNMPFAFYGCRQTDEPNFYIFGRVFYPERWWPIPPSPDKP